VNTTVELKSTTVLAAANSTSDSQLKGQRFPLYLQVLAGFAAGSLLGVCFGTRSIFFGIGTVELGELGMLVIRLLKTLAIPLVLFAIVNAILKTPISGRQGRKLLLICAANVTVALTLGLLILNSLEPGKYWKDSVPGLTGAAEMNRTLHGSTSASKPTLHPLKNLAGYIPEKVPRHFQWADGSVTGKIGLWI
jgi:Na+/H+-dicarboxylate symporter